MANRRIEDFGILADAQDDDLFLIASGNVTYALKYSTLAKALFDAIEAAGFEVDPDDLGLEQDYETGYVYPTYKGVRSTHGLLLTAKGDTLFAITLVDCMESKYIEVEEFNPMEMRFIYYSTDGEGRQEAANGTGRIVVDGEVAHTFEVVPGENTIDVEPYLDAKEQKVVVSVTNAENNLASLTYTIRQFCTIMIKMTEHTLTGDYTNERVERVGPYAFYNYDGLTSVSFPAAESIEAYGLYDCGALVSAYIPAVRSIRERAFANDAKLTGLDAPELEIIDLYAFYGCTALATANIRAVRTIAEYAFYNCPKIPSLSLPDLMSVGPYAFYACTGIKALDLPAVREIGTYAFSCKSSNTMYIQTANLPVAKTIGDYAFMCNKSLAAISLPEAETIGVQSFYDNHAAASINIPLAKTIGTKAFGNNKVAVTLSAHRLETMGNYAFMGCAALQEVELPSLTTMGTYAFQNCTALTRADFSSLTSISAYAFTGCTALNTLILRNEDAVCTLANTNAISSTPIASGTGYIYVPAALLESYTVATNWLNYINQFRAIEDYPDICGVTA